MDKKHIIEQLCHGAVSYKDIKEREVKPVVMSWLSHAQRELLDRLWTKRAPDLPINSKQEAVILASMGLDWRHVDESTAQLKDVTADEATAAFTEIWPKDPAVLVVGDPALAAGLGVEAEPTPDL